LVSHIRHIALALLFIATPALSESSDYFNAWVPAGWKLILSATGDLNRDGIEDAVLVLEETNPANFKPNEGLGAPVLNVNPRRLLILLKTPDGYRKVSSRDNLLPSEHDEDSSPCLADPLLEQGGISISDGRLIVKLGTWLSCGSSGVTQQKFTFRLENDRFRLIGYDHSSFSRSTGEASEDSINYLTGRKKTTTGENVFEKNSKPEVSWSRISGKHKFYLDEIAFTCYLGDKQSGCAWNQ